jgi:chromosome segregation ATPase
MSVLHSPRGLPTPDQESREQMVTCPACGRQFPLTDALAEELASHVLAGREPALRDQIIKDVQASYAHDLQDMQQQLRDQEQALKQDSEVIKKLRADEVRLRQDRRKLEDDRDALQAEQERMRDEIRGQERRAAERKVEERYETRLREKDEAHATEVREFEDKLKRVNSQLDEARRKSATGSRQEEGFTRQDLFAEELGRRFPRRPGRCRPARYGRCRCDPGGAGRRS